MRSQFVSPPSLNSTWKERTHSNAINLQSTKTNNPVAPPLRGEERAKEVDGTQQRPYDTVLPLSQELGLQVDTSCQRDDSDCVADVVENYTGFGNILICWEHAELTNIVTALGDQNAPTYPDSK